MKNRSILSFLLSLLFILPARAYDIPEVSVGLRLGGDAHFSMAPLFDFDTAVSISNAIYPFGVSGNFALSVLTDIKTREWFAFTPEITMGVARSLVDKDVGIQANWHDINFDILAKFFVSYWYFAAGPGFSIITPPAYHTKKNYLNSNVGELGDNLKLLGLKPKMTTRFTVTLDTGAYIPVTPNKDTIGYITISWRTVIAPMVFEKLYFMSTAKSNEIEMHYMDRLSNRASTMISTGLFVGFNYIVNNHY